MARVLAGILTCLVAVHQNGSASALSVNNQLVDRRKAFAVVANALILDSSVVHPSHAVVRDETENFAENWWTTTTDSDNGSAASNGGGAAQRASDEIVVRATVQDLETGGGLGLELDDIRFRSNIRVIVKAVRPDSLSSRMGVQPNWVVVGLNGQSTERTNAKGVVIMLQSILKDAQPTDEIEFVFRDPSLFRAQLETLKPDQAATTQVAPAGQVSQGNFFSPAVSQGDQKITVEQLVPPTGNICRRGADVDDLIEISYVGRVLDTGVIFDGSAVTLNNGGIPGRGNDVTLYFVLGKQPLGQFPPSWDQGIYGMCVGERRRITVPPVLAYGAIGVPRRNIPPNATI